MVAAAAARRGVTDFFAKEAKRLGYVARSALKLSEIHEKFKVVKPPHVLDLGCHPGAWLQVACKALGPRDYPRGVGGGGVVYGVDLRETETDGMRFVDARVVTAQRDVFDIDETFFSSSSFSSESREGMATRTRTRTPPPRSFTTVLSDMAPSTTGNAVTDAARSYELAEAAVRLALGDAALDVLDDDDDDDVLDDEAASSSSSSTSSSGGDVAGGVVGDGDHRSDGDGRRDGVLRKGGNLVVKLLEGPGGGRRDLQTVVKPMFDKFQWYRPKATRRESSEVFLVARGRR